MNRPKPVRLELKKVPGTFFKFQSYGTNPSKMDRPFMHPIAGYPGRMTLKREASEGTR